MISVNTLPVLLTEVYSNALWIVTPQILKPAVSAALNKLLAPIQKAYHASAEWQEIALKAYPPPPKKEKKVKKQGTQHPGFKNENTKGSASKEAS
jgi:tyrosyl-tRNA synthetase